MLLDGMVEEGDNLLVAVFGCDEEGIPCGRRDGGVGPGVEEELDDGPVVAVADPRAVLPSLATASIVAATAGRVSR